MYAWLATTQHIADIPCRPISLPIDSIINCGAKELALRLKPFSAKVPLKFHRSPHTVTQRRLDCPSVVA